MPLFCLFVLAVLINGFGAWDQVSPRCFQDIFPRINEPEVWNLTFLINKQNSSNASIEIVNSWVDENWKGPITHIPSYIPGNRTLNLTLTLYNKEFARRQAIAFVEHRWTVKDYVRHLYRFTQKGQNNTFFTEEDGETLRKTFWEADKRCRNTFKCAAILFFKNIGKMLAKSDSYQALIDIENLIIYQSSIFNAPNEVWKKLHWELRSGRQYNFGSYYEMFTLDFPLPRY